ncbi:MAG TPA: DUF6159 family protein [Aggregatilineales bacterium]|nr:DUF6159 family protein [Aggregatilineales bacterium]
MRNRNRTTTQLIRQCWDLLRENTEWMKIPLFSSVGVLIVTIIFGILAIPIYAMTSGNNQNSSSVQTVAGAILLFLFYFVTYGIVIYSETALVSVVLMKLRGQQNPKAADGYAVANKHMGAILGFAALSATVGVIARAITESGRNSKNFVILILASLLASVLQGAWTLMTMMVTPVIATENLGTIPAISRSWALFKQTWGEQVMGRLGLGFLGCLLTLGAMVPGLLILGLGFAISSPVTSIVGFGVLVIGIAVVSLLTNAAISVFKAVLYHYATEGNTGGLLDEAQVKAAFQPA